MSFIKKNNTSESEIDELRKKNINQTALIFYGLIILISVLVWYFLYDTMVSKNKSDLFCAIVATFIANGVIGFISMRILNKEKEKVLDASIERVRTALCDEYFVVEGISESLKRGFKYCNNKVDTLIVSAVSTNLILPPIYEIKKEIHIDKCLLMMRGYGEKMSRDEEKSDGEIKTNIEKWEALKDRHKCIKELNYIRHNHYSLNYYCIFDKKFITFGQYYFDDEKNLHNVYPFQPFSITDETKIGQQIINNSIEQFESYFNSEKKNNINFDEFADRYDKLRTADKELVLFLIKECSIEKNTKILDFGCGTGNYIEEFRKQDFTNIFGLDTSEKMREIASKKTSVHIYERLNDIANEHFDIILIIDVIHLIKDINYLAEQLCSKCADGAIVAVVTQSHEQIKKRRYREFFPSAIEKDLKRYHNIDTLIRAFESAHFNLYTNEPISFKENTIRILDYAFLDKVEKKCFSMFELIKENEFNSGIEKFKCELKKQKNKAIEESYAGKTILLFSKTKKVAPTSVVGTKNNHSDIISSLIKFFTKKTKKDTFSNQQINQSSNKRSIIMKITNRFLSAATLMALAFTFSCSTSNDDSGGSSGGVSRGVADIADYRTTPIGTQVWMAENLKYDVSGSKCYNDDPANCTKYGRLYDWVTAMDLPDSCDHRSCSSQIKPKHQGICPNGWHIPSSEDWDKLLRYLDGTNDTDSPYDGQTAGKYLKAANGWDDYNGESGNGEDTYGFSALPGGLYRFSFEDVGGSGFWWSASEYIDGYAYGRFMLYINNSVLYSYYYKPYLFSVRCLQD